MVFEVNDVTVSDQDLIRKGKGEEWGGEDKEVCWRLRT